MSAFSNIHTLNDSSKLGSWLIGIARNKLKDFYQSRKRRHVVEEAYHIESGTAGRYIEDIVDPAVNPAEYTQSNQLEELMMQSLGELKDTYRVVLYLRLFEELSYVEIAARLGLKDGTVRIRARRGLHLLRKKLTVQGITPDYLEGDLT